jgi:ABC-type transport system substrate-binding protein
VTGANTIIFRWQAESAARLLELQSGTVDGIDNVGPTDFEAVKNDPNLQLVPRQPLNVGYLGTNPRFAPMDNVKVRQALAMGIDRERIVKTFYPEGSTVADYFTPCAIENGCVGDPWYKFDPEAAKKLLADAGFPDGFQIKLYYRENPRPYLPEPARIAEEIQAQLKQNLNIDAQPTPMESGAFLDAAFSGKLDGLYLLGWIADYPHVTDYLQYHFTSGNPQFGDLPASLTEPLDAAAKIADPAAAKPYYEKANAALKESALVVPLANGVSATAYKKDVENPQASPLGNELFAFSKPDGRDTFIFMQSAEPANLFSADEDDGEALRVSDQIMEGLYGFKVNTTEVVPVLAESCTANEDGTVWVCKLRQGVKFSDGSDFTAMDVVATFNMGLNPGSPTHVGNTNNWSFYAPLWGLMEK